MLQTSTHTPGQYRSGPSRLEQAWAGSDNNVKFNIMGEGYGG